MHELGLVNYVVKQVGKIAEENQVKRITSVTLEFGEVSGIVTSYLYDYWKWYTKKFPMFDGAELRCETIPAITWCDDCKQTYPTVKYGKTCPHCGSGNTWLQQGNEMNIKQIEVEDLEEGGSDDKSGNADPEGTAGAD
ncbi:MAG: hydrogenase maturation nickel metallochaperone HypA [Oscillospiraceae bacterium]|nr:hydrogenase maturation nickel metallochaperone HypA [Oscillospiraceae bacterium]